MDRTLDPDEVAYAGVLGQRELLRAGRLTSVELLDLCLARIDRLGRAGAHAGRVTGDRDVVLDRDGHAEQGP